jgi:4-amino-4-deoxy-L-arabinose transferase-like glycosyltransferase
MTSTSDTDAPTTDAEPSWWRRAAAGPFVRRLTVITVVAFLLRLVWVLVATRNPVGQADPLFYASYADSIANGDGYSLIDGQSTAYYPAGYSLILGALVWAVRLLPIEIGVVPVASGLNLVAGTATVVLLGLLGRRLVSDRAALIAAALLAVLPNLVVHTATVLTETVFNLSLMAVLAVWMWRPWEGRDPTTVRLAVTGALVGVAVLIRPVVLPAVALAGIVWLFATPTWRRRLVGTGALVVGMLVIVGPWVVRNAVVMDRVTLALNTGDNLCIGNNPAARGSFSLPDECFSGIPGDLSRVEFENYRDRELTSRALAWIRENPGAQPGLVFWRTYYTFEHDHDGLRAVESYGQDPWMGDRVRQVANWGSDVSYFAVMALALLAVPRFVRRGDLRLPAWLAAMAGFVIAVWPFFGDTRFHIPFVAMACLLAGVTLAGLPWGSARRESEAAAVTGEG